MNFFATEEQKLAAEGLRKFLDKEIEPIVQEYRDQFIPKEVMKGIMQRLVEFGLIVAPQSEDVGGLGLDWGSHLRLIEEVSYTSPDIAFPLFINTIFAFAASQDQSKNNVIKERYLPGIMAGELFGCFAVSEPDTGSDVASMKFRAKIDGDHYVLNGEKMWITNGVYSDFCLVLCLAGEAENTTVAQILVDRIENGYEPKNISKIGLKSQSTSQIHFNDVRVPRPQAFNSDGSAIKKTLIAFETGRLHVAAISCGIARRALDEAIKYSQDRIQHGKPIAGHQMIADKLAVMATELDAARLLILRAAKMIDERMKCDKEVSMAKWYANEMAVKVTRYAMAIHGANGLSTEFLVEKLAREALVCIIPDGTPEINKLIIARRLTGIDAFK